MRRPADVPGLTLEECVSSALMAASERELIRTVRAGLWCEPLARSQQQDITHLVPPGLLGVLGRPRTFSKLIAAVRRQMKANQTSGEMQWRS